MKTVRVTNKRMQRGVGIREQRQYRQRDIRRISEIRQRGKGWLGGICGVEGKGYI